MIEKAPMFQVESVWLKLTVSAILASILKSGISSPSMISVWFVFIVLCNADRFAGLEAAAHWFSKYVAALLGVLVLPQVLVHVLRRELIIGLAVLSYFYPNTLAIDSVVFLSSYCLIALIEGVWPKIFSYIVMALMIVVPAVTIYTFLRSDYSMWAIVGATLGNFLFFMLGRITLWNYKLRWQPKAPDKDAVLPEERRLVE